MWSDLINHMDDHHRFGTALHNKGDREGAMAEYRAALRLNPNEVNARYNLARTEGERRSGVGTEGIMVLLSQWAFARYFQMTIRGQCGEEYATEIASRLQRS